MQGLELSRRFYFEAVRPILDRRFPRLEHAAALIGWGSEVLGFDDETSRDHQWGPRLQLFVAEDSRSAEIDDALANELPTEFAGFPTNFGAPGEDGSRLAVAVTTGPVAHLIEVVVLSDYLRASIGVDPRDGFAPADWLATPSQRLLEVTAGEVFDDPVGELTRIRDLLAWYPHDVWLLVMAGHWRRIAQFEHLHGRAGLRGDDLGSGLLGAELARDLMRLGFLQHRCYAPYPKWFGSAYAQLDLPELPALEAARTAPDWRAREAALIDAAESVARRHNELRITDAVDSTARQFHGRPIRVLDADRFVTALRAAAAADAVVAHLAGSIDAVSDSTDVLSAPALWRELRSLWAGEKETSRT